MLSFVLFAILAGLILALVAGPLGCFIVWRRMAYFGDTLAHSALLGIAMGLLADINLQIAVVLACMLIAFALLGLEQRKTLATDTLLGILAHSSLALSLVMLSFTDNRIDLMAYLFGDLLAISTAELLWLAGGSLMTLVVLLLKWNELLSLTLHPELAHVEGLDTSRLRIMLLLIMALMVAVSMKIVGVLLITSLLIIPPATARHYATSPEQMALGASVAGMLSVIGGITASWYLDTPPGPSIVTTAALLFILSHLTRRPV